MAYSSDFRLARRDGRHLLQSFTNYTSTVEQSPRFHQVLPLMVLILKVQYQCLNDHADSTIITKINHYWFESEFRFSKHNTSNIYTTNCKFFSKSLDKTSSISARYETPLGKNYSFHRGFLVVVQTENSIASGGYLG